MTTVIITIKLDLPGTNSLKQKRSIIRSVMARVKNKFNISIAEVAEHDRLRTAILGAAVVSNDAAYGQAVMEKVIHQIALVDDAVLADYSTETY